MDDALARLRAANAAVQRRDDELGAELLTLRHGGGGLESLLAAGAPGPQLAVSRDDESDFGLETIVRRTGRPVLAIRNDAARLVFSDPDSVVWRSRLESASAVLAAAARAVGRIEVTGHPQAAWVGTGWLVGDGIIVTNRHVAAEFGRRDGSVFRFRPGIEGGAMTAGIDFLQEVDRTESLTFRLERILHIEDADGPDLAFLAVTPQADRPWVPIALAAGSQENDMVAVIGYPARDSRIPDQPLMDHIFGDVYDKKRLAPGLLTAAVRGSVGHDCSTLGGNSGSVVVSLATGEAVGLHFAGRFLKSNFAVPGAVVGERLAQVRSGDVPGRVVTSSETRPDAGLTAPASTAGPAPGNGTLAVTSDGRSGGARTFVIPLRITVELGEPASPGVLPAAPSGPGEPPDDMALTEAAPQDYRDRTGYDEHFLGGDLVVGLPTITRGADDVLTFTVDGRTDQVLRYEHFTVLMSRRRRMCRYSAVNIDGRQSLSMARVGWRLDPRIPRTAQIRDECYGNPPMFARGHMTRREDPIWGERESAAKGNSDSMHVTNAVPQMQPFNAGVWLDLENYALQNARHDDMRICVFTGPFLDDDDPVRFGVQVPVEFWKIIAFIHDETGTLSATGYTMSQRDFLSEQEFVFGRHHTAQRSIASIEQRAGLSFGALADVDPFEDVEGFAPELHRVEDIRLVPRR